MLARRESGIRLIGSRSSGLVALLLTAFARKAVDFPLAIERHVLALPLTAILQRIDVLDIEAVRFLHFVITLTLFCPR